MTERIIRKIVQEITGKTDVLALSTYLRQATVASVIAGASAAPSLVVTGGVGTSYNYTVIVTNSNGDSVQSTAATTAVGPTTLDGTHYITVTVPTLSAGQTAKVLRTVGGTSQGVIATGVASAGSVQDTGLTATAYTKPPSYITVTMGTSTQVRMRYLAWYTPFVNDSVFYLLAGGDMLALGDLA